MEWVSNQLQKLLPVPYFHAVFTIPDILKPLALHNKKKIYSALFYSVHKALAEVAKREENLGATIGGISVLHTWNQQLGFHPHIHCILPGIGIGPGWGDPASSFGKVFPASQKALSGFQGDIPAKARTTLLIR